MAKYLDKNKNKVVDFSEEDIKFIKERKLTRRYVPYLEPGESEVISPGNILKPQLIVKKGGNRKSKL